MKPSHLPFHYSTSLVENRFQSEIGQIILQPLFSNTYLQGKNKKPETWQSDMTKSPDLGNPGSQNILQIVEYLNKKIKLFLQKIISASKKSLKENKG